VIAIAAMITVVIVVVVIAMIAAVAVAMPVVHADAAFPMVRGRAAAVLDRSSRANDATARGRGE
jgi:hypothetical protein